jgi:hypothetical protein
MSQGKSLRCYLKQTKMYFFSFTQLENRRAEQVLPWGGGLVPMGQARRWGKNMWWCICCKYCAHMYVMYVNGKMGAVERSTLFIKRWVIKIYSFEGWKKFCIHSWIESRSTIVTFIITFFYSPRLISALPLALLVFSVLYFII